MTGLPAGKGISTAVRPARAISVGCGINHCSIDRRFAAIIARRIESLTLEDVMSNLVQSQFRGS